MNLTPHSLFNIILKIFGLFFLREIVNEIPTTVNVFYRYFRYSDLEMSVSFLIVSFLILCFYAFIAIQILFKPNVIINALKLDKGFSEHEFSLEKPAPNKISLTTNDTLTIALTIIGGYLLVNEIPDLIRFLYLFMDEREHLAGAGAPGTANVLASIAKILLALLILGERKRIVDFISKEKNNTEVDNAEEQK